MIQSNFAGISYHVSIMSITNIRQQPATEVTGMDIPDKSNHILSVWVVDKHP